MSKEFPPPNHPLASNAPEGLFIERRGGTADVKSLILAVGGFCAAAAGLLVWRSLRTPNVDDLAHSLEEAWADHHTVV
jgi:hypothetical protein